MKTMSKSEYADHRKVNRSTVTRWVQAGRIPLDEYGRIDPDVADRQLAATGSVLPHHQARSEQIDDERQRAGAPPLPGHEDGNDAIARRMKLARVRTEEMKAESAMLDRDEKARDLVRRADVEFVMDDIGRVLGNLLERLADRYTPSIASHKGDADGIHATLVEAALDTRREFEGLMQKRAMELQPQTGSVH